MSMTDWEFGYRVVTDSESNAVTSLIAYEVQMRRPLQAVLWSVPRKKWIYNPIARAALHSELPKEQTLLEMFEEGERMGWEFGPPQA
jgi:hypothetical protein